MALPLFVNCNDILTCPVKNHLNNGIILTVIYGIIVFLILTAFPNKSTVKTKTKTTKTPSKKRTKNLACPDAPRPKRQRINNSPILSSSVARELFPEDNTEKVCPNAPIKQKKTVNIVRSNSLSTIRELFAEDDITSTPNAPIKQKKAHSTNDVITDSVATKLNFAEDQVAGLKTTDVITKPIEIADIRTRPDNHEQLTPETVTICSFYKPGSTVEEIEHSLSTDADTIDFTNQNRKKPSVNRDSVINYLLTLNRLVKNLQRLNESNIALPHAGTGTTTTRTDQHYFLIDKLMNATVNADVMNRQLAAILLNDYDRLKYTWTAVPKKYVQVCHLSREVAIMSSILHRELSYNMNLTPWSDW
jgi:hypothetical protein